MSPPFHRLITPALSLESFAQCTCRRNPRSFRAPHHEQARSFSSTPATWSGHSKWATIKHDKGKNDAAKSKQRTILQKDISIAVRLGGSPDPKMNSRLALAIATAKKNAMPKANIEAAIARGQGLSASGAALENLTVEAILPPSIAAIFECQTDNKLRTLSDLRLLVKNAGGTASTVGFMFEKKGRIVLQKKEGVGVDEVLEPALEAGVLDVLEDEQGRVVLLTEPAEMKSVGEALAKTLGLEIAERDIIYDPNEDTKVALDDPAAAEQLIDFFERLQQLPGISAAYLNWTKGAIDDALWAELQSKADV
ncbi:YebC-like protein [Lentithecium fluviatile CBS 122367]|uniref:YebC-like protein n=1 Tax=Lentithecium fluviatile CBS 122367 TaxID=1168545 RepID=A0A6G1JD11_9PLEO|nr:YebC-like protein [Lentithecium fluviatile CBS 122367]